MTDDEKVHFFDKEPKISYNQATIDRLKHLPINKVCPASALINEHCIAGLFITTNAEMWKFFKIGPHLTKPKMRFRMHDLDGRVHAMEVVLRFEKSSLLGRTKIMRLQLNPMHSLAKYFLIRGFEQGLIGLYFYNKEIDDIVEAIIDVPDEDLMWFRRNYDLVMDLKTNLGYRNLVDKVTEKRLGRAKEKCFKFYAAGGKEMLVEGAKTYFERKIK